MEIFNILLEEYIAIAEYLRKDNYIRDDILCVNRISVVELMDRNPYITASKKFKIWSNLKWIRRGERDLTLVVYNKNLKKLSRVIAIELSVVNQLKDLRGNE